MATKIDDGLRPIIHTALLPRGFFCQAIETGGTGLGIPDTHYIKRGATGWIESKRTEASAVSTLKAEQVGWGLRYTRNGGMHFYFVRQRCSMGPRREARDVLWCIHGSHGALLKDKGLWGIEEAGKHLLKSEGGPSKWDWDFVERLLTNPYPG